MTDRSFEGPVAGIDSGQAALLRLSFQRIAPVRERVAEVFYGRLFELDPSLRPLFRGDMRAQGHKLVHVLEAAVTHADRFSVIAPVVEALGRRHVAYGVREAHYATVRAALVHTLQELLGDELTPATAAAWADLYDLVAGVMMRAAREVAPPPSRRAPLSSRAPVSQPPPG
jgi:hemoglobin-like flavoprotein